MANGRWLQSWLLLGMEAQGKGSWSPTWVLRPPSRRHRLLSSQSLDWEQGQLLSESPALQGPGQDGITQAQFRNGGRRCLGG